MDNSTFCVLGLSGLLATSFVSTYAFAEKPTDPDAQHNAEEPKVGTQPAGVVQAAAAAPPTASVAKPKMGDVSVSGYLRGGFGASSQKGRMTCFRLSITGGLVSKYRLGNECEVWSETEFTMVAYAGDDGSVASVHVMPTVYIPTDNIGYSPNGTTSSPAEFTTSTGATLSFPNLYVDIKGIPWLFGGTPWAGTRYYKRESVYISDFFYWNPSGVGGGIEDINLGNDLRLSYGVFAVDGEPAAPSSPTSPSLPDRLDFGFRNDLQLRGIKPYESGEFQIGFQYIADFSNHYDAVGNAVTHGGWGVTVQHVQKLLGGENKLAFQYGRGGGTGFGTLSRFYYPDFSLYFGPSENRMRIVDVLTVQPTDWFGSQVGLVYQRDDLGNAGQKEEWYSGGARVSVAFAKHAKVLGEAGYDRVKKSNGSDPQWLAKFTIAPTIAAGKGFMSRPELRLFYTYAMWNETARGATVDSAKLYTATEFLSGGSFGLQGETWW